MHYIRASDAINEAAVANFNLLVTLDVLLSEGSVAGAARRLRLSPSAMSRALARLREVTGDPLLVRAGRSLVPTPRAIELREQVGPLVDGAKAVLRPAEKLDLSRLERSRLTRSFNQLWRTRRAACRAAAKVVSSGRMARVAMDLLRTDERAGRVAMELMGKWE